jgi:cysteinyl-tRNA synthetase
MPLNLYNTLTKTKQPFTPLQGNIVRMYTCGPTVYSEAHIGNMSTYLMNDLLGRYLTYTGYDLTHIENITDVGHLTKDTVDEGEDKMTKAAREQQKSPKEIAAYYTKKFNEDKKSLRIVPPTRQINATDHILQMIEFIKELIEKGHAYERDGNVYFDISTFPKYGKLSGNTLQALQAGARVTVDTKKKSPYDFYLWRNAAPEHLMQWDSPWGRGYPGWHIECSVMSRIYLGDQIDIHTGGEDNIFPHHEDEIAQTESLTGKQFSQFWVHRRHILVDGKKMSKSLGNMYTLSDLIAKGFDPLAFRYLALTAHYRKKLEFSFNALESATQSLKRIHEFVHRLHQISTQKTHTETKAELPADINPQTLTTTIEHALDNDLNTPSAMRELFAFITKTNTAIDKNTLSPATAQTIIKTLTSLDRIFDFLIPATTSSSPIPKTITKLAQEREHAKTQKDFATADAIRTRIEQQGFTITDTPYGPVIKQT